MERGEMSCSYALETRRRYLRFDHEVTWGGKMKLTHHVLCALDSRTVVNMKTSYSIVQV